MFENIFNLVRSRRPAPTYKDEPCAASDICGYITHGCTLRTYECGKVAVLFPFFGRWYVANDNGTFPCIAGNNLTGWWRTHGNRKV